MKKITTNKDGIFAILILGTIIGGAVVMFYKFSTGINALADSIAAGILKGFF